MNTYYSYLKIRDTTIHLNAQYLICKHSKNEETHTEIRDEFIEPSTDKDIEREKVRRRESEQARKTEME